MTEVMETEHSTNPLKHENGVDHEANGEMEVVNGNANTNGNGTTNGNGLHHDDSHEEPEEKKPAANGHDNNGKHNESVSELAASVKQRQRKQVERFLPVAPQSEDRAKEFVLPQGKGVKLGELDNVEFRITRTDAEDLKPLHRVLFGSAGKALTVRKNLRAFSGFDFEKDSPQYEKKIESIKRFTVKGMKFVLQLLDLETKGEREELETRLMDFLMNPQPSGKKSLKDAAKEATEKKKKSSERKKAAAERKKLKAEKKKAAAEKKKSKKSPKKSPTKKADGEGKGKKRPAPTDESGSEDSDSGSDSGSESDGSESDSSVASAVSSASSAPTPSPAKKAKPAAAKKASPTKSPAKKAAKKDDAKAELKTNGEPTDDELHTIISDFVKGADLETVTMKNVIAHVFAKFPSQDLTSRKPWIKETVKQLVAAAP